MRRNLLARAFALARRRLLPAAAGVLGIVLVFILGSCGSAGEEGRSYIAYTWAVGPISFYSEDPAFAGQSIIYNGEFRETRPGSWYFEYLSWDNSLWYGTYEIYVNEGEDGGLFTDGEDGSDLYFELACYSFGPSFYVWDSPDFTGSVVAHIGAGRAYEAPEETERLASGATEPTRSGELAGEPEVAETAERVSTSGLPESQLRTEVLETPRFTIVLRYRRL